MCTSMATLPALIAPQSLGLLWPLTVLRKLLTKLMTLVRRQTQFYLAMLLVPKTARKALPLLALMLLPKFLCISKKSARQATLPFELLRIQAESLQPVLRTVALLGFPLESAV